MATRVALVAVGLALSLGLGGGLACEVEQKVVRLRPRTVEDRARLPEAPSLEPTAEVIRYPDGAYSVDGLLREAEKLVGEQVRLKGFVRGVTLCDVEQDPTCTDPPHAFLVDDLERPKRAMLVVGTRLSRLSKMKAGEGETLEGKVAQVSPDGRFVRARGMLVLPDLEPPPQPVGGPDAGATPEGATPEGGTPEGATP